MVTTWLRVLRPGYLDLTLLLLLAGVLLGPTLWDAYRMLRLLGGAQPFRVPLTVHQAGALHWREYRAPGYQPGQPTVLLIHGTPGSWDAWRQVLDTIHRAGHPWRVLVPDRAGFGRSQPGRSVPALRAQAAFLAPLLPAPGEGPCIVVGHSYGGPVAVRLAQDYPRQVSGLLLCAASVDPALEHIAWYQRLASRPPLRDWLPDMWRVSNEELLALPDELRKLEPGWTKLEMPIRVLQGTEDGLVPPANADYIRAHAPIAHIRMLADIGHLFPFTHPGWVVGECENLISEN